MGTMIDLTGQRYGRLVVIRKSDQVSNGGGTMWECKCDCGNTVVVRSNDLRTGNTKSCGCFKEESRYGRRFVDLTGQRFGKLTVIGFHSMDKRNHALWNCVCDCGNNFIARSYGLRNGDIKSCGCLHRRGHTIDNISRTSLYSRWRDMIARCYNPKTRAYADYGARGIYVCDEWKDDVEVFYNWALENGYSPELSIDRIDNDGPYAPWNCRWVDTNTQANNKRNNISVKVGNSKVSLQDFLNVRQIKPHIYGHLRAKLGHNGAVHSILNPDLGLYVKEGIYYDKDGYTVLIPKRVYRGKNLL